MTYANPQTAGQPTGANNPGMGPAGVINQTPSASFVAGGVGGNQATQLSDYKIIRRNGSVVAFEPSKIAIAVTKAFLAVNGGQGAASARVREQVEQLTNSVIRALLRSRPNGGTFHIEDIQDQVELALMRSGEHNVARAYVLYREKRNQERAAQQEASQDTQVANQAGESGIKVTDDGQEKWLDMAALRTVIEAACEGLGNQIDASPIITETIKNLYDGVPMAQVYDSAILASRTLIEKDPAYSQVTARILMHVIRKEIFGKEVLQGDTQTEYGTYFAKYINEGISAELLDPRMREFDLPRLAASLNASRDLQFNYLGLQTLYDRYFLHIEERRIEMP